MIKSDYNETLRIQQDVLMENFKNDLTHLKIDIQALTTSLLRSPLIIHSPSSSVATVLHKPHQQQQPSSRLGRLGSALAQHMSSKKSSRTTNIANRWIWGDKMGPRGVEAAEEPPLLNRRRSSDDSNTSADSDMTLVGNDGHVGIPAVNATSYSEEDSAGVLLAALAPVIAALQCLGVKLRTHVKSLQALEEYKSIRDAFLAACGSVLDLLMELKSLPKTPLKSPSAGSLVGGGQEGQDLEMRSLMLEALKKKVKSEQHQLSTVSLACPPKSPSHNDPFAFHSVSPPSSLGQPRRRSTTQSVPIKISAAAGGGQAGEITYRSFMADAQQSSWALNVVRLGSFQASALFTPSPVAVRRLVGDGGKG
ncbi:hypothetical protein IAR50_001980 [Cryptococcus sp. DSM 104548]